MKYSLCQPLTTNILKLYLALALGFEPSPKSLEDSCASNTPYQQIYWCGAYATTVTMSTTKFGPVGQIRTDTLFRRESYASSIFPISTNVIDISDYLHYHWIRLAGTQGFEPRPYGFGGQHAAVTTGTLNSGGHLYHAALCASTCLSATLRWLVILSVSLII